MYKSIDEIRTANEKAGLTWFGAEEMRFFNTRIDPTVYPVTNGAYFVTRERYEADPPSPPGWTVRFADAQGSVRTHGHFMHYASSVRAHMAAANAAAEHVSNGED